MNFRQKTPTCICAALFVWFTIANFGFAQTNQARLFWSNRDLGEGAIVDDLVVNARPGETGTMYLYYLAEGFDVESGFDFDFAWNGTAVGFTAAESFDFDIAIAGAPFGLRWGDFSGPAGTVEPFEVRDFLAVNVVNGEGLRADFDGSGIFLDTGYDFSSGAFQLGSFDWVALERGASEWELTSSLSGPGQICDSKTGKICSLHDLTINVIPEPGSTLIFAISLLFLTSRRRGQ